MTTILNRKRIIFIVILSVFVLSIAGFLYTRSLQPSTKITQLNQPEKKVIYTSIYPIFYFTQEISNGIAEVVSIIPNGAEPHDYEPSNQQITSLTKADLVIYNGSGIDTWADKISENNQSQTPTKFLNLSHELKDDLIESEGDIHTHEDEHEHSAQEQDHKKEKVDDHSDEAHSGLDPHFWLDPVLAQKVSDKISAKLIEIMPEKQEEIINNTKNLSQKLALLDQKYKTELSNCSLNKIVLSHNSFGYISKRYGFEVLPINGMAPEADISLNRSNITTKFIQENNIKYIGVEPFMDQRAVENLTKDTETSVITIDPIENISEKDLSNNQNYMSKSEQNLQNLKLMLQCS